MNILKFATNTMSNPEKYQLRTASGRTIEVTNIVNSERYPIRGVIKDTVSGLDIICEWDENGYPHNLPYNHGLNLLPYRSKTVFEMIPPDQFKSFDHR